MIEFEITESVDSNALATYKFFQNQIYIGRTTGDLLIQDSGLRTSHLMIEVIERDVLVHPQKEVEYFLINGKRATTIRKMKSGDLLTLGKTTLKILKFESSTFAQRKDILDSKFNKLVAESSSRLTTIEQLSKMMRSHV